MRIFSTLLISFLPLLINSQNVENRERLRYPLKITVFGALEKQGYQEYADFGWAAYAIIDKYGPSRNYGINLQLTKPIRNFLQFDFGVGLSKTDHLFSYSLMTSSHSDFYGFVKENNHGYYLESPLNLYYHKKNSKRFYISPGIGITPRILLFKQSSLTAINSNYEDIISPGSDFRLFVPKVSLDLALGFKINKGYSILTDFFVTNNSKYYKEEISNIFFRDLSFGLKLALERQ
jgi:hypothetical protein